MYSIIGHMHTRFQTYRPADIPTFSGNDTSTNDPI